MKIYLVRHAHALDGKDDDIRPLSAKGWKQIRHVAAFFRGNGRLETREFWHSPLVRARDTAQGLVKEIGRRAKRVEVAGLRSEDKPAVIAKRLKALRRPVAVVGHEPHLSALASLLVAGRPRPVLFEFKKCAVVCLQKTGRHWVVRWQVAPGLL